MDEKLMKFFIFFMFFMLKSFVVLAASSNYCSQVNAMPQIELKTSYGNLIYDFSMNASELTKFSKLSERKAEKGVFSEGYTHVLYGHGAQVQARIKHIRKDFYCIWPEKIELRFYLQDPKIYIANNIPKASCRYALIVRHEQMHAWIYKTTLDYFLPVIWEKMQNVVKNLKGISVQNKSQAQAAVDFLQDYYKLELKGLSDKFATLINAEHDKFDNWDNYNAEAKLCDDFDKRHKYYTPINYLSE